MRLPPCRFYQIIILSMGVLAMYWFSLPLFPHLPDAEAVVVRRAPAKTHRVPGKPLEEPSGGLKWEHVSGPSPGSVSPSKEQDGSIISATGFIIFPIMRAPHLFMWLWMRPKFSLNCRN